MMIKCMMHWLLIVMIVREGWVHTGINDCSDRTMCRYCEGLGVYDDCAIMYEYSKAPVCRDCEGLGHL